MFTSSTAWVKRIGGRFSLEMIGLYHCKAYSRYTVLHFTVKCISSTDY